MKDLEKRIAEAESRLQKQDERLGQIIELQKPLIHKPRSDYFRSLCGSIISQQVSVAAAATIFGRFEAETGLKPQNAAALNETQIKTIGLSRQKAGYIKDLAAHFVDNPAVYNHLGRLGDEEVIADLTAVKGIGEWTAQMFLMFTLVRLDVFAPDDVGIQRAMMKLYGWKTLPKKDRLIKIAESWRPYRTVACWHLWHSLDNTPK